MKHIILTLFVAAQAHAIDTYDVRTIEPDDARLDQTTQEAQTAPIQQVRPRKNSIRYGRTARPVTAPDQAVVPPDTAVTLGPEDGSAVRSAEAKLRAAEERVQQAQRKSTEASDRLFESLDREREPGQNYARSKEAAQRAGAGDTFDPSVRVEGRSGATSAILGAKARRDEAEARQKFTEAVDRTTPLRNEANQADEELRDARNARVAAQNEVNAAKRNTQTVKAQSPTETQALGPDQSATPQSYQQMANETQRRERRDADNREAQEKREAAARHFNRVNSPEYAADREQAQQNRDEAAAKFEQGKPGREALASLPSADGARSFLKPIPQFDNGAGKTKPVADYVNPADVKAEEKDVATRVAQDELTCVYGGVIKTGDKCRPSRRMSQEYFGEKLEHTKVSLGNKTVDLSKVVCAPAHRNKKGKLVRSTDSRTGLCEPLRYGLQASGKALCAQPGPSHSQGCANAAKADPASKNWALAILNANPKAAKSYAAVQSRICGEDAHKWNTKIASAQSREDIRKSCEPLTQRTADLGLTEEVTKLAVQPAAQPKRVDMAELPAGAAQ